MSEARDEPAAGPAKPLERARDRIVRAREAAVELDSQPRLLAAVTRLRRALPGDERFGDPLSTEGRRAVQLVARGVSALEPDRPSAVREMGLGALQVWQSLAEATGRGFGDRSVAVLFTDLVKFSSWALDAGDTAAVSLLREVGDVVEAAIVDREGTIVKRLGDGLMAAFEHPQPAVEAALDALEGIREIEVDGHTPTMRAGIHYGRPRKVGSDYLGVDVNVAARVGGAAKGEQVLVSEPACELLEPGAFKLGRAKRLSEKGAPTELRVRAVSRA